MILDSKQQKAAKKKLGRLNKSIARIVENDECGNDPVKNFELAGLKGFSNRIQQDIDDFEILRTDGFEPPISYNLTELPKILIQARIAWGWSQQRLADCTGTKLEHLQLYEEELYLGASFSKKMQIAEALGIETSNCALTNFAGESGTSSEIIGLKSKEMDWTKFPVQEVFDRGWITKSERHSNKDTFKNWFQTAIGPYSTLTLQRRKISDDENTNWESVLTWEARVLQLAESELANSTIPDFELNERWLPDLVRLTYRNDGPTLAKAALRQQGILLVYEKKLSNTNLDGAAMLSHEGVPIIALTLRFDRLDYFWFTLFHELGHVYLHLYSNSNFHFFDQGTSPDNEETSQPNQFSGDELEAQANKFALGKLIDANTWDTCLSRFSATEQSVVADANRLGIHPSIIAGRVRNERGDYSILSGLIGQGSLHNLFGELRA